MYYYLGQIGIFGFNFAPVNWALCNGTILPISQNAALFSLIGTYYGGNGTTTFALPDLRSRTPYGIGNQTVIGQQSGVETVPLTIPQMPLHTHTMQVNNNLGTAGELAGRVFAAGTHSTSPSGINSYAPAPPNVTLAVGSISFAGSSQPHTNIQPYETVNFCIATSGVFPPRS